MKKTLSLIISSTLLLGMSLPSFANNKGFEGWYQIEVIIFNRTPLSDIEVSPKDITLKYPLNWQDLKYPEDITVDPSSTDELMVHTDTADLNFKEDAAETPLNKPAYAELAPEDTTIPFLTLNKKDRLLDTIANRFHRRQGYRVLFHEAWRQVVTHESTAPSILISGGEKFGEHYELEGSININVSRYLHLQTNLWFSKFQINAGQSRYEWPELPKNPKALLESIDISDEDESFSLMTNDTELPSNSYSLQPWESIQANNDLPDFLASPYLPINITTLQQKRRMRSKEIHYIDHPTLGIIIKIVPYKSPEIDNENSAQGKPTEQVEN